MSGKSGKILGILGLALVIFITIISGGTAWAIMPTVMLQLTVVSIGLIQGAKKQTHALENTGAVARNTATADANSLCSFIFGTTLVPLVLVYEEVTGEGQDRILHDIYAHAWHKINAYKTLRVGTSTGAEAVTFTNDADPNAATGYFGNLLWWYRKDGAQTTPLAGTQFDPNSWPADAVFKGVAHSAFVWNVDDDDFRGKFGSAPQKLEIEVEGAMLYDPRLDDAYGSGPQDFADRSTWTFNNGNAALVLLRGVIGEFAGETLAWGRGATEESINMQSFMAMANVADEALDGDVRFRLGGMWVTTGSFEDFVSQWEHETGGKLSKAGGRFTCWLPNDDLTPITTITEADMVAGVSIQHTIAGGLEGLFNTARGRYIDAVNGYSGLPYPEITEDVAVAEDGGKRVFTQDFSWVQTEKSAQRIARIWVRRSRFMRLWAIPMGWKGQGPAYSIFSIHILNCKETNYRDQLVRVVDRKSSYQGSTLLTLQQEDASIYDETLALLDPLANTAPPNSTSIYGTITRSVGPPGKDAVYVTLTASNGLVFTQAPNDGPWSPVSDHTDVTFNFIKGAATIAEHIVRVTRTGNTLSGATFGTPSGDATTFSQQGAGTNALTITVTNDVNHVAYSTLLIAARGGAQGTEGTNGLSIFYASVFARNSVPPSTPHGGSYNFGTQTLTPPPTWSVTPPAGSLPLYISSASFSVLGTTGTDNTTTWSTPELFVKDGAPGEDYWTPILSANMERIGKTFSRSVGTGYWDSGFYSLEVFGACQIQFSPAQTNVPLMVGLNTDPATDHSYTSIDYALYCAGNATLYASESGVTSVSLGPYAAGDALAVSYDGNHVRYLRNGAVLRTMPIAGAKFGADSSFSAPATVNNVAFSQIDMGRIDLTTKVFNQLTAAFADAGLVNSNLTIAPDGSLVGGGGGAPVISELQGTLTANQMLTNVLVALQAKIGNLSAIKADMGTITAGTITLDNSGHIKSGQTGYNTGIGFFLGYAGGRGRFSLGDPATNFLTWDGTSLHVRGVLDFASASFTPTWGGFNAPPVGNISYIDFGSFVVLWSAGSLVGTSNTREMTLSGIPLSIRPAYKRDAFCILQDAYSGTASMLGAAIVNTDGTIKFGLADPGAIDGRVHYNYAMFLAEGMKGIMAGWTITYAK